jgi:hypothetical protein
MTTLWCHFSLGSNVCGVVLDAETDGGDVKSCLPDWFHGGVDNSTDKDFVELYPEGGPTSGLMVVMTSKARAQGACHGSATLDVRPCVHHRVTQWMPR